MLDGIDPDYFSVAKSWADRRDTILGANSQNRFASANIAKLAEIIANPQAGARMVVNIGAWSLRSFLRSGKYLNMYELAVIGGNGVDTTRGKVDQLLGFGHNANEFYFGAVALETAGVRFYGEYCMVLKGAPNSRIFDRDSYELVFSPLDECSDEDRAELSRALRGKWDTDLAAIAALKCRDLFDDPGRLVTEGRLRDALLCGEEFIEVHRHGTFTPSDLDEVCVADVDMAMEGQIASSYERGILPRPEDIAWIHRRVLADEALAEKNLRCRVADADATR